MFAEIEALLEAAKATRERAHRLVARNEALFVLLLNNRNRNFAMKHNSRFLKSQRAKWEAVFQVLPK
jgi:hypothetical protein